MNGIDPYQIRELIEDYNSNPQRYSDGEAETIAVLAQAIDARFQRDGKPFSKGLFDVVDTATFGMLPNEWRPTSRGESVYGETGAEKLAGVLGTGAGMVGGIGSVYKMGRGIIGSGAAKRAGGKIADAGIAADRAMGSPIDRVRRRIIPQREDFILDPLNIG